MKPNLNEQPGSDTTCKDIEALEGVNRVLKLFRLNRKFSDFTNLSLKRQRFRNHTKNKQP